MENRFVKMMKDGENCFGQFSPDGTVNGYRIGNTFIPYGNDSFDYIKKYLDSERIEPICLLEWVKEIRGKEGELLHYLTNIGSFIDSTDNTIALKIKEEIKKETIIVKESNNFVNIDCLEINVFLPRSFQLHGEGYPKPIDNYCFDDNYLELPFPIKVEILQQIEKDFFAKDTYTLDTLRKTNGNILRYTINKSNIVKIYKWAKQYLTYELESLEKSLAYDYKLYKRKQNKGPRTQWCFDYFNLQSYIWIPILYITNKLIYLINNQSREKTIGLISKHELGNTSCIKAKYNNGTSSLISLSNIRDEQISIYPSELNWNHKPLELPMQRIRFLFDQGLYFEAVVVTQALCESIVNGMFPNDGKGLKWEKTYKYLSSYFNDKLGKESKLRELLNGELKKIYKYRNDFAHDYLAHTPDYTFEFEYFNEIKQILESFLDMNKNMLFLRDVDTMYRERNEFIIYYKTLESEENLLQ